jgi:predicted SprT family Zn-dependent metalloprotease
MNLDKAEKLTLSLMHKHNLRGWSFKWDNSLRRFGCCSQGRKYIGLSRKLVEVNNVEQVKDTILHEIAHALAGPGVGHGQKWKDICVQIGAKPERCYDSDDTNTPEMKYYAVCGACGRKHEKARLKLKHVRRSCLCQSGKDWNNRVLLEFQTRY